jgi:two-component system, NarL family, nitrate/nitrite response regulator NarL
LRSLTDRTGLREGGILTVVVYSPVRLFADGVAACLDTRPDTSGLACHDFGTLTELVGRGKADVVLMDVTEQHALAEGRALVQRHPGVRIVALALPEAIDDVIACADAGFASYVPRNACAEDMYEVLRRLLREEVVCDPKISSGLLRELRRRNALAASLEEQSEALTRRECEVLRLLGRRLSNKEIARELCLSTATVKNHVHSILAKLHVRGRSEALARLQSTPQMIDTAFHWGWSK